MTRKVIDKMVEAAYSRQFNRVTVVMTDLTKIFSETRERVGRGEDADEVMSSLVPKYGKTTLSAPQGDATDSHRGIEQGGAK